MPGLAKQALQIALAERPPWARLRQHPAYPWFVVATVCIGAFMGQLDASIVALALPTIQEQFAVSLADAEWVALAYLITLAGLVVVFGRVADLVGRKSLYTIGFGVFTLGSALCGMASSLSALVLARVAQGVGAAMLQANSVALITQTVPGTVLGRAIGVQGTAQAVGLAVGPAVGGFLVQFLNWRWVFFLNVPAGLLGTGLALLALPVTAGTGTAEGFDWAGAFLLVPAVAVAMYALTHGQALGWGSTAEVALLGLAGVLLLGFALVETRGHTPLVDPDLFRRRSFTAGIAAGLLSYAVLFGALFLLPLALQRVGGLGPALAGGLLMAVPAAMGVAGPAGGLLADRHGPRWVTAGGMLLAAAALATLAVLGIGSPAFPIVLPALGLGLGLFTPANNAAIMGAAPPSRYGVAAGTLNMTRSLGTSLGVAAVGAILEWRLAQYAGGPSSAPGLTTGAFHETLLVLAGVALAAVLISLVRSGGALAGEDAGLPGAEP